MTPQRAIALLACAAAFAACEGGVSLHPSPGEPPAAGASGAGGGDGSLGTSGNAGNGGSLGTSGNAGNGGSLGSSGNKGSAGSLGSSGSAGSGGSGGTGDASQETGGTGAAGSGGTDGLGGDASDASDAGATDAGDGGECPAGCPSGAPVCSTGACRKVKQMAPGGTGYLCALVEDGTVRCWGKNEKGQLGDGSRTSRPNPGAPINGLTDIVQLSAGFEHSCALTRAGSVWCWGHNHYGQLGFSGETLVPVEVKNLGGQADEVTCRGINEYLAGQSCARLRSGKVKCWGANYYAQLGNGTRDDSATPVEVLNLTDAVQIAMTEPGACALKSTGKVVCWGGNGFGMAGTGSTADFVTSPEEVVGLSDVHMVDGGDGLYCAVTGSERRVKCWGRDIEGELGDGPAHNGDGVSAPVDIPPYPVEEMRAGWRTTCARLWNGEVVCWGLNGGGLLGNGTTVRNTDQMTSRTALAAPAVSLAYRWTIGCAILNTGRVQCWGGYANDVRDAGIVALTPEFVDW